MRAVIYARYSSDLQREASIEDQVRLCKERIALEGWYVTATYTDSAQSGASRLRGGYQKLLEDARKSRFDLVIAEVLDRLSRDQEDVASLYKRLTFAGVRLFTVAEGEINELHVGLKGTMNALFLKDLAQKVRRGIEGRVRQGRSGGGLGYGYEVVREFDARGERARGMLTINKEKAAIVRRIFEEYATGRSPRAIAGGLNSDGVPGPSSKPWGPSTINGNWRRGTGILNNELYVGRRVWNRQRFINDPSSGKRVTRYNEKERLIVQEIPGLRIISEPLWKSVKQRRQEARRAVTDDGSCRSERARRPAYLLSGLLRCGVCSGGFSKRSDTHYACSTAHDRGTCSNRLRIRRDVVEASVLSGLKNNLMRPELVREFIAEFHREMARLGTHIDIERSSQKSELTRINQELGALIDAIKSGLRSPSMEEEIHRLEARRAELAASIQETRPPLVHLHPNLAIVYADKISRLQAELNREDVRNEAAQILRGLISEIRLIPDNDQLEIELHGDLAAILTLADASSRRAALPTAKITLVAGERYHLYRTVITWMPERR